MRVEVSNRKFEVRPDEHSWLVAEVKTSQSRDNRGEERLDERSRAYLTTIDSVAAHLFEYNLRKADADSLAELVVIARELQVEIAALFGGRPEKMLESATTTVAGS